MIEKTLYDYLNRVLTVPAYLELPAGGHPQKYVTIEKTGSSRTNMIDSSTIAVQSVAPSLYEAAALNYSVRNAMDAAVIEPDVVSVRLNSDYNYTDQQKHEYRYQAVFEVVHY